MRSILAGPSRGDFNPLDSCNYQSHILNISLSTPQSIDAVVTCYAGPLMVLADKMRAGFNAV